MTPDQFNLMRQAAQSLLDHQAAGRKCDPDAVRWAQNIVRQQPPKAPKDCPSCMPVMCTAECREAA